MHKRLKPLIDFYKQNTLKVNIITVIVVVFCIGTLLFFNVFRGVAEVDRTSVDVSSNEPDQAVALVPSSTTGKDLTKTDDARPVIAAIISNSSEARPQSGLSQADVVFEAIAEGGITRYLALFHDNQAKFIGPVRSLRPYFIDFARGFNAFVAHVGGSPRALNQAKTELGSRDLNQFSVGTKAFERVSFRFAPHNVYTDYKKLRSVGGTAESSDFTSILRKEPEPAQTPDAANITVNYSAANYNTAWKYNSKNNTYRRFLADEPHIDRDTKQQLEFDVVVVIKSDYSQYTEGGTTYNDIKTSGSGTAFIFQDGTVDKVKWSKKSDTDQYLFTKNDQAVALNSGSIWFAIQPTSQTTSYE